MPSRRDFIKQTTLSAASVAILAAMPWFLQACKQFAKESKLLKLTDLRLDKIAQDPDFNAEGLLKSLQEKHLNNVEEALQALHEMTHQDYRLNKVEMFDGWLLSKTELMLAQFLSNQ